MRSHDEVAAVRERFAAGLDNSTISRQTGIPISTVRAWRTGRTRSDTVGAGCPACNGPAHDFAALPSAAYAYLLGQYLGDGYMVPLRRTYDFHIVCCDDYPGIKAEVADAIRAVLPGTRVGFVPREGCTRVRSYSRRWPCLLPQHGPGRKHERPIVLTDWQIEHCERAPRQLLRGLIHSDGSRCVNRVTSKAGRTYAYPSYFFNNESDDILLIFAAACQRVGVRYRWCRDNMIGVARRPDVARLDAFVGPKT